MISTLQVPKRFGTYADPFLLLGLARLAALTQLQILDRDDIQLTDLGAVYQIQLATPIELSDIVQSLKFEQLFDPVKGDKTKPLSGFDWAQIQYFDTIHHRDLRTRWRNYERQKGVAVAEDAPMEPDPRTQNGVVLTSMRHDHNHNQLWQAAQSLRDDFGGLVAAIFQAFNSSQTIAAQEIGQSIGIYFRQFTQKSLPNSASAVKLFMPTAIQGVNRLKADNNTVSASAIEDWVMLWLIATGLFHSAIAERIKISDSNYDWRVVALEPKDISLFRYNSVLNTLRKFNPPSGAYGVARFDAETVLRFSLELLNYHPANNTQTTIRQRGRGRSIQQFVSGFSGTHFGSKGQVYGVKEVFSLGLPNWICPSTKTEVSDYQFVLQEHLKIVKALSFEEGYGELLAIYRDFMTSSDRFQFFRFQVGYADAVLKSLADPSAKFTLPMFSYAGLEIMTQSFDKPDQNWSTTEITQNQGFQRIARAINSATVYAGKIKTEKGIIELDWQRHYGLAQRLSSHSGSKRDFIAELTAFLTAYEHENLRLSEQLQKEGKSLRRVWVTREDLETFLSLLDDSRFGCNLVAHLLLAYGYAKWKKPADESAIASDTLEDNKLK